MAKTNEFGDPIVEAQTNEFGDPIVQETNEFGDPIVQATPPSQDIAPQARATMSALRVRKRRSDLNRALRNVPKAGEELRAQGIDVPDAQLRAFYKAKYLQEEDPRFKTPNVEKVAKMYVPEKPPGRMPAFYEALAGPVDVATSPVARPFMFAPASAKADVDAFARRGDREQWASFLHPDDPRKELFVEFATALDDPKKWLKGAGLYEAATYESPRSLEAPGFTATKGALKSYVREHFRDRLGNIYYAPGMPGGKAGAEVADPYGGTGLPRPWQDIDKFGKVAEGQPPADATDILLRGMFGLGDDPEQYETVRRGVQTGGSLLEMLGREIAPSVAPLAAAPAAGAAAPLTAGLSLPAYAHVAAPATAVGLGMFGKYLLGGEFEEEFAAAQEAIEEGDTRKGLFVPEMIAMVGPDLPVKASPIGLLLQGGKEAALRTGAGALTRYGDDILNGQYASRFAEAIQGVTSHSFKTTGSAPSPEKMRAVERQVRRFVDTAFAQASVDAGGRTITLVDTSDAIKVVDGAPRLDEGKVRVWFMGDDKPTPLVAVAPTPMDEVAPALTRQARRRSDMGPSIESERLAPYAGEGVPTRKPKPKQRPIFRPRGAAVKSLDKAVRGIGEIGLQLRNGDNIALKVVGAVLEKVPIAAEMVRRPMGRFQQFAIKNAEGEWTPVTTASVVDDQQWQAMRFALGRKTWEKNQLSRAVEEMAYKAWEGTPLGKDRRVLAKFMEVMGDPSPGAADAVRLYDSLHATLNDAMRFVPTDDLEAAAFTGRVRAEQAAALADEAEQAAATAQGRAQTAAAAVDPDADALMREAEEAALRARKARADANLAELRATEESIPAEAVEYQTRMRELRGLVEMEAEELAKVEKARKSLARAMREAKNKQGAAAKSAQELEELRNFMREAPGFIESVARRFRAGSGPPPGHGVRRAAADTAEAERRASVGFVGGMDDLPDAVKAEDAARAPGAFDITDDELRVAIELLDADGVEILLREGATAERLAAQLDALQARLPRIERQVSNARRQELFESLKAEISGERADVFARTQMIGETIGEPGKPMGGVLAKALAKARRARAGKATPEADAAWDAAEAARKRWGAARRDALRAEREAEEAAAKAGKLADEADTAEANAQFFQGAANSARAGAKQAEAGLVDPVAKMLERETIRARAVDRVLRDISGFANRAELEEIVTLRAGIKAALRDADTANKLHSFDVGVSKMTVSEARQSARAIARLGGDFTDAEFNALPKDIREAIQVGREFFDSMYRTLKAEGALPSAWTKEEFLERMMVEGYVNHVLSGKGQRVLRRVARETGLGFKSIDALKHRTMVGTIEEVNEQYRRNVAEMILGWERGGLDAGEASRLGAMDPTRQLTGEDFIKGLLPEEAGAPVASRALHDAELDRILREYGLEDVMFFETDGVLLMRRYGQQIAEGVAAQRFVEDMSVMFRRDYDRFAAQAQDPAVRAAYTGTDLRPIDLIAAENGFRRLNGASVARSMFGATAWEGWTKHADEIAVILRHNEPGERVDELLRLMDKAGVPPDSNLRQQAKVVAEEVFVPETVADAVESFIDPQWVKSFKDLVGKVPGGEFAADSYTALMNFFRSSVTLGALAFHGRNALSNSIQGLMAIGPGAVSPLNHAEVWGLTHAKDAKKVWPMRIRHADGTEEIIEKTVGEWRHEFGRLAVEAEKGTFTGDTVSFGQRNVSTAQVLGMSAAASAGGAVYGAATGDTPEERVARAFAYGFGIGFPTVVGVGFYQRFLKQGLKAGKAAAGVRGGKMTNPKTWATIWKNRKAGLYAAAEQTGADLVTEFAEAVRLGSATGALGAIAGAKIGAVASPATQGVGALAGSPLGFVTGFAGGFFSKYGLDGLFAIGGGVGRGIENQSRLAGYWALRKQGMSPEAAAMRVHRTFFDYDDLTPFERYFARNVLFPFWTWTSRNAFVLQPWLMMHKPREYQLMNKMFMSLGRMNVEDKDMAYLPKSMQNRMVIVAQQGRMWAGVGSPVEAMFEWYNPGEVVSRGHPGFQFMSQFVAGWHPFYDRPTESIRNGRDLAPLVEEWTVDGSPVAQAGVPTGFLEWIGMRKVANPKAKAGYTIETGWYKKPDGSWEENPAEGAYKLAALRSIPWWRLWAEWNKATVKTFLHGGEVLPGYQAATGTERFMALVSGFKPKAVDWQYLQERQWREVDRSLSDIIKATGATQKFETIDVPSIEEALMGVQ